MKHPDYPLILLGALRYPPEYDIKNDSSRSFVNLPPSTSLIFPVACVKRCIEQLQALRKP